MIKAGVLGEVKLAWGMLRGIYGKTQRKQKVVIMNSIEKITTVTMDEVASAYAAHSERIKAAANDVSERYYRRHNDGINATDDMPEVVCPAAPEMPPDLAAVINRDTYGIQYVSPDCSVADISMHGLTRTYQSREYFSLVTATPEQYLAGLRAIDALAADYERLARGYKVAVIAHTEQHIKGQYDAARELAAAVLAGKK